MGREKENKRKIKRSSTQKRLRTKMSSNQNEIVANLCKQKRKAA